MVNFQVEFDRFNHDGSVNKVYESTTRPGVGPIKDLVTEPSSLLHGKNLLERNCSLYGRKEVFLTKDL